MSEKRLSPHLKKWLEQQFLVVVGYWDSKGVNLNHLLELWYQCKQDNDRFPDVYPEAAEHFEIEIVQGEDTRTLYEILSDFEGCRHVKVWCLGDDIT